MYKAFKKVHFGDDEKPPEKRQKGFVQFIEPISGKERFRNAKNIDDLLNK